MRSAPSTTCELAKLISSLAAFSRSPLGGRMVSPAKKIVTHHCLKLWEISVPSTQRPPLSAVTK